MYLDLCCSKNSNDISYTNWCDTIDDINLSYLLGCVTAVAHTRSRGLSDLGSGLHLL
jgi:hypothetical protein